MNNSNGDPTMDLSSSEANTSKLWGPDDELLKI
jgi:hypothetical protein